MKKIDIIQEWENVFRIYRNTSCFLGGCYNYLGIKRSLKKDKSILYYTQDDKFYDSYEQELITKKIIVDSWIIDLNKEGIKKYFKLTTEKEKMIKELGDYYSNIVKYNNDIKKFTEKKLDLLDPEYISKKRKKYDGIMKQKENWIVSDLDKITKIKDLLKITTDDLKKQYSKKTQNKVLKKDND